MIKKIILFVCFPLLSINLFSQGYWTPKAMVINGNKCNAASFSIGNKGYICTGVTTIHVTDLLEYDPATNTWTQKADFPGVARRNSVSFSIGYKAYVGLGSSGGPPYTYYNDFYEYNSFTNTWSQKANFPGPGRAYAHHLTVVDKGYIGGGVNGTGNVNDWWEYDPVNNTWTQKNNPSYPARNGAVAFSLKQKGFVGTGQIAGPVNTRDFWEYNPPTDTWTQKADLPGGVRNHAVGFAIDEYGYIITGYNLGTFMKDFWQYDIPTDTWTQLINLTGVARSDATGFGLGNKVYIGTGWDGNTSTSYLSDFWEYTPATAAVASQKNENYFNLHPNPANNIINISLCSSSGQQTEVEIFNSLGEKIHEVSEHGNAKNLKIDISEWKEGIYFIEINIDGKSTIQKFIKLKNQ